MKLLVLGVVLAAAAGQTFLGQPAHLVLRRGQTKAILRLGQPAFQLGPFSRQNGGFQDAFTGSRQASRQRLGGFQRSSSGSQSPFIGSQLGLDGFQQRSSDSQQELTSFQQGRRGLQVDVGGSQLGFSRTQQGSSRLHQASGTAQNFLLEDQQGSDRLQQSSAALRQGFSSNQEVFAGISQGSGGFQQGSTFQQVPGTHQQQFSTDQQVNSFQQKSSSLQTQSGQTSPNQFQQGAGRHSSEGSRFQTSADFQFGGNQLLRSGLPAFSENLEGVRGVFEPLNLPSGATLLLGDISSSFSCVDEPYGYYADQENSCRVFHVCYPALFSSGRVQTYQYSFMCSEGSVFDQREMTCVQEADAIPCSASSLYFSRNEEFGLPHERASLRN